MSDAVCMTDKRPSQIVYLSDIEGSMVKSRPCLRWFGALKKVRITMLLELRDAAVKFMDREHLRDSLNCANGSIIL